MTPGYFVFWEEKGGWRLVLLIADKRYMGTNQGTKKLQAMCCACVKEAEGRSGWQPVAFCRSAEHTKMGTVLQTACLPTRQATRSVSQSMVLQREKQGKLCLE